MNARNLFSIVFILFLVACSGSKESIKSKDDGQIEVIFLQINDVYEIAPLESGKTAGMARLAGLRNQLLKENPNTLTVLAGDFLNPSIIGTLPYNEDEKIRGRHMVEVMNEAGIDLVCFGNHEFDLDEKDLQKRINESNFQWISTNVLQKTENGTQPFYKMVNGQKENIPRSWIWEVEDADGTKVKIGFYSACIDSNPKDYVFYEDHLPKAFDAYRSLLPETDMVIGFTHLDIEEDIELAEMVPETQLIMGGHNHYNMKHNVDGVVITKADANARTAYVHRISYNTKSKKVKASHELVSLDESIPLDPKVEQVVKKWTDLADNKFKAMGFDPYEVLLTVDAPLDGREINIRSKQTNLGQLITKSMSMAFKDKNDCSIVNSGSVRLDDQLSGNITQLDIIRTLPYGGKIFEVTMTGKLLHTVLNEGISKKGQGAYLQWDKIEYDENQKQWKIDNEALNFSKNYKVIVSEYLLLGIDIESLSKDAGGIIKITGPTNDDPENPLNDIRTAIVQNLKNQ